MEEENTKKIERNKEKRRDNCKKKDEEKKIRRDTNPNFGSSLSDQAFENIIIIGKSCNISKSKSHESGYLLHECRSETDLYPLSKSENIYENMPCDSSGDLLPNQSCTSFISAKSDISNPKSLHKTTQDFENETENQMQFTLTSAVNITEQQCNNPNSKNDYVLKLKEMQKKIIAKEKKIKDLNQKVEECCLVKKKKISENKGLNHQLQSMYELMSQKNWDESVDPAEFLKYKNKTIELQSSIEKLLQDKEELKVNISSYVSDLDAKDKELNSKKQELIDFKNRSALEMCKLINQIDSLKQSLNAQSQMFDTKIFEAQNSMDDEIVRITTKLEDQYQKDLKVAIEKLHCNYDCLTSLPLGAVENLLQICEPDISSHIDWTSLQKNWDRQQRLEDNKTFSTDALKNKEITYLKDTYEAKILFLRNQVQSLSAQLKEKKEIMDIFECELMACKGNSPMKLLRSSSVLDDFSLLKELYTTEIFSQNKVHKLEMNVFEYNAKTLAEEILYHAKNEENYLHELVNAKKMAYMYREKYEKIVSDWEEKVEKSFQNLLNEKENKLNFDDIFEQIQYLIHSLNKVEKNYEENIKKIIFCHDSELFSYKKNIEVFRNKMLELEIFQTDQLKLDKTIEELIENVGNNYIKTIEALVTSHSAELSLKQLEACSIEKQHLEEVEILKNKHQKEIEEVQNKFQELESSKVKLEKELNSTKLSLASLQNKLQETSSKLLKCEGLAVIKEETELVLNERVKELEQLMKIKEENCQNELEDLVAKLLEVHAITSAKNELIIELEDKLNNSEVLLEKSCYKVDNLLETFSHLEEKLNNVSDEFSDNKGDFTKNAEIMSKFASMQTHADQVKLQLLELFQKIDRSEEINFLQQNDYLKNLKKDTLNKNNELEIDLSSAAKENSKLIEKINTMEKILEERDNVIKKITCEKSEAVQQCRELLEFKEKHVEIIKKLELLESEKEEIICNHEILLVEKNAIENQRKALENEMQTKKEEIGYLVSKLENINHPVEDDVFSFSLQEVRLSYHEELVPETEKSDLATVTDYQEGTLKTHLQKNLNYSQLRDENEILKNENLTLKAELDRASAEQRFLIEKGMKNIEEIIYRFKNELSKVINEREQWVVYSQNLEKENEYFRQEIERVRENFEDDLKWSKDAAKTSLDDESFFKECKINDMKREIGQLGKCINVLSAKLDAVKANNERLLSESQEHIKNNQNLTIELEEAWAQRYEIEDQLSCVRRENALLNVHRVQLENTNKRISNLVSEGKPSVVSWLKIHETVENIVDEVLALKTSFADVQNFCDSFKELNVPKTQSESKLINESLQAQLNSKTILYDELLIHKKTLEKELKILEDLLKKNDSRILYENQFIDEPRFEETVQSNTCPSERQSAQTLENSKNSESLIEKSQDVHFKTLNLLKKQLDIQEELEEVHYRENLKREIQELKMEVQDFQREFTSAENSPKRKTVNEVEEVIIPSEFEYEDDFSKLVEEFGKEIEKLKCGTEKNEIKWEEKEENKLVSQLENVYSSNEKKQMDLEKKYQKIYTTYENKLKSTLEKELLQFFEKFQEIFNDKNKEVAFKSFLGSILEKYIKEILSLRTKHKKTLAGNALEIKSLLVIIDQMKNNFKTSTDKIKKCKKAILKKLENKYEKVLQEEKAKLNLTLEEIKQKYESEILKIEKFWGDKLKECEKKYASLKPSTKNCSENFKNINNDYLETSAAVSSNNKLVVGQKSEKNFTESLGLRTANFGVDVKTDDDKLEILRERDSLKKMVFSLQTVVAKLLSFIGKHDKDFNEISFSNFAGEDTIYKSLDLNSSSHTDHNQTGLSTASVPGAVTLNISNIIQEINEHSLLNLSNQVQLELDKCLQEVKNDAAGLLALSEPEGSRNLHKILKKMENDKNSLEEKVLQIEEMHNDIKGELEVTKKKLAHWEKNIEVVSEGYGEEVVESKKEISVLDLISKLKSEQCSQTSQELHILEEIFKEGYRLQEEWKQEKIDLQQQIDVADKQVHLLKKFMEEQAAEREQERETFDKEIIGLKECLKAKERDYFLQGRTNREGETRHETPHSVIMIETLEMQVKDLMSQLNSAEESKKTMDSEFQNAVKKIWSLRELIEELEVQLAEVNERESNLKKKFEKLHTLYEEEIRINESLKNELELCKNADEAKYSDHVKKLEEELLHLRDIVSQLNPEALLQIKSNLRQIEADIVKKTKELEQVHLSSTSVSCSSPSEDVSIRDRFDATRCSTPDEMNMNLAESGIVPFEEVDRLAEKLVRHTRAEEVAIKYIRDLKMQLKTKRKSFEELQTERDVLLDRADLFLKENSVLKARMEEQRCNAALIQKQLNAELESQVNRLELEVEKLNELCIQKDKQLQDINQILENTTKTLKQREVEVINKSKEENVLISVLKTDLENALSTKKELEEKVEIMKEKMRKSLKLPALIDSMIEEKNAEIDRLEKEVSRLSSEKTDGFVDSKTSNADNKLQKNEKHIKFPELLDSFGDCISPISSGSRSVMRCCSRSYSDFKNSSLKIGQPSFNLKLESLSSIEPLQLSPRGSNFCSKWKTSSPMALVNSLTINETNVSNNVKSYDELEEEPKLLASNKLDDEKISELKSDIEVFKEKVNSLNEQIEILKSQKSNVESDLEAKKEEILELKNNEKNLIMTIEVQKNNHMEEVENFKNKLSFENDKVRKVYEEIKELEVKKVEIEEAFFSLKKDYCEKINEEQKMVKVLTERIRNLESKNCELEKKIIDDHNEKENIMKEKAEMMEMLRKQICDAEEKSKALRMQEKSIVNVGVQVDDCSNKIFSEENKHVSKFLERLISLNRNMQLLKQEVDKITESLSGTEVDKMKALIYLNDIKNALLSTFYNIKCVVEDLNSHKKKEIESLANDETRSKVQKELFAPVTLNNDIALDVQTKNSPVSNSILNNNTTSTNDGGGDSPSKLPNQLLNSRNIESKYFAEDLNVNREIHKELKDLEMERDRLIIEIQDHQKIIKFLEDSLEAEKKRCKEDAKIMKLLQVNLEKGLRDIKFKDKEIKREKNMRMALEKELEVLKKTKTDNSNSDKTNNLKCMLKSQEEKLELLSRYLESEKLKNQELRLLLEQSKIEKISEKEAQRLLESDYNLLQEQKESLKAEMNFTKQLLFTRDQEISLLKRKISLQEIDIKALSLSKNFDCQSISEKNVPDDHNDFASGNFRESLTLLNSPANISESLLLKMNRLNTCVQRHVQESNEMGEALLHLSEETEQMRRVIKNLERNTENDLQEKTLISDEELDKRLWNLEKEKLLMDIENLKAECENVRRESIEINKSNEILVIENSKLKAEMQLLEKEAASDIEIGILKERIHHLIGKYLRAESYRKALAWQKQYFLVSLNGYKCSREIHKKINGKSGSKKKETKVACRSNKFKVIAWAAIAVFRMKFIVKKWQRHKISNIFSLFDAHSHINKRNSPQSVASIYNDPLNPLAYQTHNLFR